MRSFSTCNVLLKRAVSNPRPLILRPPVAPLVEHIKTPEDHPLWQFFGERKFLRAPSNVNDCGNSWTIPQLRRKSFEDLHALWFVCLKEWNKIAREAQVVLQQLNVPGDDTQIGGNRRTDYDEAIEKIRTSMWRIRHVLAERYHGWRRAELEIKQEYPKLLAEFSKEYLEADSSLDATVNAQMDRFQYAFFGINPKLEGNIPEANVLKGIYVVAKLKLQRYGGGQKVVTSLRDVREAFLLFSAEPSPEGIADAIKDILEVRKDEPAGEKFATLAQLMLTLEKDST